MRLMEEIVDYKNEEEREEEIVSSVGGFPHHMKAVVVGYALTSKKIKSFLQPKLQGLAR